MRMVKGSEGSDLRPQTINTTTGAEPKVQMRVIDHSEARIVGADADDGTTITIAQQLR